MEKEEYVPGVCNIGKEEINRRKRTIAVFSIFTVVCILLMQLFHVNHLLRLFIFIPVSMVGISILQVYMKFCVNFGMRGVYNFNKLGETSSSEIEKYIRKDKQKAMRMIMGGVAFGFVVAVAYYFLPV